MSRKYKCPTCLSTSNVIKQRSRKTSIVYLCKACKKYFSHKTVGKGYKPIDLLNDHLEGFSFKDLGLRYGLSKTRCYKIVYKELLRLPSNNKYSYENCNRFSPIFMADGKYIEIKGYEKKIPMLWGVDYLNHDFPIFLLATSECFKTWNTFFILLRTIYYPQLIACDDNPSIKASAMYQFPKVKIQTCYNHYKENIRRETKVRSDDTYKYFVKEIEDLLSLKRSSDDFNKRANKLLEKYYDDNLARSIVIKIAKDKEELLGFTGIKDAPLTTNLIESFNSHLQDRLASIRGFENFNHAKLWLNGYVLKRRFTKLTDCRNKFKYLNGKLPIEQTKKLDKEIINPFL